MKLVYAVSQRTKAKRPAARHIDTGEGKPLVYYRSGYRQITV